jgi:hypothetical protein
LQCALEKIDALLTKQPGGFNRSDAESAERDARVLDGITGSIRDHRIYKDDLAVVLLLSRSLRAFSFFDRCRFCLRANDYLTRRSKVFNAGTVIGRRTR